MKDAKIHIYCNMQIRFFNCVITPNFTRKEDLANYLRRFFWHYRITNLGRALQSSRKLGSDWIWFFSRDETTLYEAVSDIRSDAKSVRPLVRR